MWGAHIFAQSSNYYERQKRSSPWVALRAPTDTTCYWNNQLSAQPREIIQLNCIYTYFPISKTKTLEHLIVIFGRKLRANSHSIPKKYHLISRSPSLCFRRRPHSSTEQVLLVLAILMSVWLGSRSTATRLATELNQANLSKCLTCVRCVYSVRPAADMSVDIVCAGDLFEISSGAA